MAEVVALRDHIEILCARNEIRIGRHSRGGNASRRGRFINIRPVKSAITYAVALHEIGHVLGPWQSQPRLYKEAGAWKWATENALVWTPVMQKTMTKSLTSYLLWQRRRSKYVRLPEAEHEFWQLVGQDTPHPAEHDSTVLGRRTEGAAGRFQSFLGKFTVSK